MLYCKTCPRIPSPIHPRPISAASFSLLLADDGITEKHLELKRVDVPGMAFTPKVQGTPWKNSSLKEILQ
jgi:hypothetical protein